MCTLTMRTLCYEILIFTRIGGTIRSSRVLSGTYITYIFSIKCFKTGDDLLNDVVSAPLIDEIVIHTIDKFRFLSSRFPIYGHFIHS